jgi:hypothetical protein
MFKKVTTQMRNRLRRYCEEEGSEPIDMTRYFIYATFDIMGEFTLDQPLGMVERLEFLDWIRRAVQKHEDHSIHGFSKLSGLSPTCCGGLCMAYARAVERSV